MEKKWTSHDLQYRESFEARRPVLDSLAALQGRWRLSKDGARLETDLELTSYSRSERNIIEYAINPHMTAQNIFTGLDYLVSEALATSINEIFGPKKAKLRAV